MTSSSDENDETYIRKMKVTFENPPATTPFVTPASSPPAISKFSQIPLENSSTDYFSSNEELSNVQKSILKPIQQSKSLITTPKLTRKVVNTISPHDFRMEAVQQLGHMDSAKKDDGPISIEMSPLDKNDPLSITPEKEGCVFLIQKH